MKPEELHLKSGARNAIEGDGWKFEAVKDFVVVFDGFSCADHDLDEFLREDAQNHQTMKRYEYLSPIPFVLMIPESEDLISTLASDMLSSLLNKWGRFVWSWHEKRN